jgi:hypothetical protein
MGQTVSRKQYWAIKNALTKKEHELIDYYEVNWMLRSYVPTVEEVAKKIKQSQVTVNYYLARAPVEKALDDRGIPWRQHTQTELTATQVAVAVTMMNFMDTRSSKDKLDQLGITDTQYYAWLNDPQFKHLIEHLGNQNLANIRPAAIAEFTKKVNQGDWNAIKFWLETTGELKSNDAPQSEQLIRMIVEIVQKHVKDPETIIAIAQDIKLASANRTLEVVTSPPMLTGEIVNVVDDVEDPDLERAKKMLMP